MNVSRVQSLFHFFWAELFAFVKSKESFQLSMPQGIEEDLHVVCLFRLSKCRVINNQYRRYVYICSYLGGRWWFLGDACRGWMISATQQHICWALLVLLSAGRLWNSILPGRQVGSRPRGVWMLEKILISESLLNWVVATQIFFIFTPNLGEMIQFDEHIFQMGWNHQLVNICYIIFPEPYSDHEQFLTFFAPEWGGGGQ